MGFIKVCSKCGTVNPANRTECSECHKDLTREKKITEEKYAKMKEEAAAAPAESGSAEAEDKANAPAAGHSEPGRMVYICENCGAPNDTRRSVCEKCGDSLAGIVPVEWAGETPDRAEPVNGGNTETYAEAEPVTKTFHLQTVDGNCDIELKSGENRLGRNEAGSAYLAERAYVSGIHAVVIVEDDRCYIIDQSTNGTFINGTRIEKGKQITIVPELDLIGFGSHRTSDFMDEAAYFRLNLR